MKTRTITSLVPAASLLFLAACGGGEHGGGILPALPQVPIPAVVPDPSEIRDDLQAIIDESDTVVYGITVDGNPDDEDDPWSANIISTPQPSISSLDLTDFSKEDGGDFELIDTRNGVEGAIIVDTDYNALGAWLDNSFFFVNFSGGEDPFTGVSSGGTPSETNPSIGTATWTGAMAGIDEENEADTFGNLVTGDASIAVDFNADTVGVSFTGISDLDTGQAHSDIIWGGLELDGGVFSDDISDSGAIDLIEEGGEIPPGALIPGQIFGQFYGPDHEEVGGIFNREQISGAFGAIRD